MAFSLDAYFARTGYQGNRQATFATLCELHRTHITAIAFENLDVLLNRDIHIDDDTVFEKLVIAGRGGYCFEQNGLFERVLREIGFEVKSFAARVLSGHPRTMPARTHRLLCVTLDGIQWLTDVGFGSQTLTQPIRFMPGAELATPGGMFCLMQENGDIILSRDKRGRLQALYRFDTSTQYAADFVMANHFISHWPDSHFRHRIQMFRQLPDGGKVTLNQLAFTEYNARGVAVRKTMLTSETLGVTLRQAFNLTLDHPQHGITRGALHALSLRV